MGIDVGHRIEGEKYMGPRIGDDDGDEHYKGNPCYKQGADIAFLQIIAEGNRITEEEKRNETLQQIEQGEFTVEQGERVLKGVDEKAGGNDIKNDIDRADDDENEEYPHAQSILATAGEKEMNEHETKKHKCGNEEIDIVGQCFTFCRKVRPIPFAEIV